MAKIYLDPGHGYDTPGKRSPDSSLLEYEFNQVVADLAEKLLLAQGFDVRVTKRMKDKDLGLTERCNLANNWGADIFMSIHANAMSSVWSDAKGWEVYSYPGKTSSAKLANLAQQYGYPEVKGFGVNNRGVRTENFAVIRQTNMPSILFEWAFFSNKVECELLKRQDFRQACAVGVAKTACGWFGKTYKEEVKEPVVTKKYIRLFSNGAQIASFEESASVAAYAKGWEFYNAGKTDVTLQDASGNVYTFSKHTADNPKQEVKKSNPVPSVNVTTGTPIIGKQVVIDGDVIDKFIKTKNPAAPSVGKYYIEIGNKLGIRGDIAVCQAIKETGWFKFGGDVKLSQNNFCGLGTTGGGVAGASFKTIEDGVMAQLQHLWAYTTTKALPNGITVIDPRFKLVQSLNKNTKYFEELGGQWAVPGFDKTKYASFDAAYKAKETYGQQIIDIYNTLVAFAATQKTAEPVTTTTVNKNVFYTFTLVKNKKVLSVIIDGKGYVRASDIATVFNKKALFDSVKGEIVISNLTPATTTLEGPGNKKTVKEDVKFITATVNNKSMEALLINGKGYIKASDIASSFGYTAKFDSVSQEIAFVQ
ncbi:Sporulation-specific N-acetylmuramoyl-L-alanine amidase [compost metagenome]